MHGSFWPTQVDFQDALQNPGLCFADPELQSAVPTDLTPFGLPRPITGQFANIYRFRLASGALCAVRLFIGPSRDRTRRYNAITRYFQSLNPPLSFVVPVVYQEEGIRVRDTWFPLIRMDWIIGPNLNGFVDANLYDTDRMTDLAAQFILMVRSMSEARVAHGDLQHGNLLVELATAAGEPCAPTLRMVDYDGLWIPELHDCEMSEIGHPSFQHPRRKPRDYGPLIDRFSSLAIYAALRVLIVAPNVWFRLDNGDNLLFRREDFRNSRDSEAFRILLHESLLRLPEEKRLVETLQRACALPLARVPSLETILDSVSPSANISIG